MSEKGLCLDHESNHRHTLAVCAAAPRSQPASPTSLCPLWPGSSRSLSSEVQWVVLAYLLAITILVVSLGRLGDIVGRRRLLLAGIALFTVASFLAGLAPTLTLLIVARAAQGLGAAIMMALAMAFVPQEKTGSAVGLLATMSALGTTIGPSLGGVLIASFGWPAIFHLNVPLGILNLVLAYHTLPADRLKTHPAFDMAGTLLVGSGAGRIRPGP